MPTSLVDVRFRVRELFCSLYDIQTDRQTERMITSLRAVKCAVLLSLA